MSNISGLQALAKDLHYAATTGAEQLAHAAVAAGKVEQQVGYAVHHPGPGLTALVGHKAAAQAFAERSTHSTEAAATHMAVDLAQGGAELAVGQRR